VSGRNWLRFEAQLNGLGCRVVDRLYRVRLEGQAGVGTIRPAWQQVAAEMPFIELAVYARLPDADFIPFGRDFSKPFGLCSGPFWPVDVEFPSVVSREEYVDQVSVSFLQLLSTLISHPLRIEHAHCVYAHCVYTLTPDPRWQQIHDVLFCRAPPDLQELRRASALEWPD
jgi:hypothetical protein